jgi:serine protease
MTSFSRYGAWLLVLFLVAMPVVAGNAMASVDDAGREAITVATARFRPGAAAPGVYLVKFTGSPDIAQVREDLRDLGITLDRDYREVGVNRVRITPQAAGERALERLLQLPGVEYVEPDYLLRTADEPEPLDLPDDVFFGDQWALHNTGQNGGIVDADIDAPEAWATAAAVSDVVVAVIDTGVDPTHPDLDERIWTNPDEIPGNDRDDDHNGYVDDIHGINTITRSGDPMDDNGHGTHCAGIIAAERNNGIGIAGVAGAGGHVRIMALKFLDSSGSGYTSDAIEAINYAVAEKKKGSPVRVISASWGSIFYSRALYKAIFIARSNDILFVAAAGNYGVPNDILPFYPASYPQDNIIAVAASDNTDHLASFSSYGWRAVDLAAPGVAIVSTFPGDSYAIFSGTSMAAPHVAGVAALLFGQEPDASFLEVKKRILSGVDRRTSLIGKVATGGRLNAYGALTAP